MNASDPVDEVARLYRPGSPLTGGEALASMPERHAEPNRLAVAIGDGLAALHALPTAGDRVGGVADGPDPVERLLVAARERADEGLVEADRLPEPYSRYSARELVDLATRAPARGPDLVWCHGRPATDQVVVDAGRFVAFVEPNEALIADRHLDLAVAQLSVQDTLGPESVLTFYEAYGTEPDLVQLDRYLLLVLLCGLVEPVAASSTGAPVESATEPVVE